MAKKLYYKIGEACKLLDIEPYVLRYWETEFPFLSPNKSKSGQRVYGQKEIDLIRRIKELLYEEGYTIAGAKRKLETEIEEGGVAPPAEEPKKKKAAPKKAASEAAEDDSSSDGAGAAPLDTAVTEEIEKLRSGIEGALRQAREILDRLEPSPT